MWSSPGIDPDKVVPIAGAVVDGVGRPLEMTGPRWMAHAVEASEGLADTDRHVSAQCTLAVGRT